MQGNNPSFSPSHYTGSGGILTASRQQKFITTTFRARKKIFPSLRLVPVPVPSPSPPSHEPQPIPPSHDPNPYPHPTLVPRHCFRGCTLARDSGLQCAPVSSLHVSPTEHHLSKAAATRNGNSFVRCFDRVLFWGWLSSKRSFSKVFFFFTDSARATGTKHSSKDMTRIAYDNYHLACAEEVQGTD